MRAPDARPSEVFHPGERHLQDLTGARAHMAAAGPRLIRDHLPEQHRLFFAEQPFVLLGALEDGWPWATIAAGAPGFVTSPDAQTLVLAWRPSPRDPVAKSLRAGSELGLLGIELATRRRNRVNGTVVQRSEGGLEVHVKQSFGNCPQYIQAREVEATSASDGSAGEHAGEEDARPSEGPALSSAAKELITRADTMFIASATPASAPGDASSGVDVSHRGGKPGFVRVRETPHGTELLFPDFRGNFFFNTLGNLILLPRAGLLFLDFRTGEVLTLTGTAEVLFEGPELDAFAGAERLVRVVVRRGVWLDPIPLRFGPPRAASQLAGTGSWARVGSGSQ